MDLQIIIFYMKHIGIKTQKTPKITRSYPYQASCHSWGINVNLITHTHTQTITNIPSLSLSLSLTHTHTQSIFSLYFSFSHKQNTRRHILSHSLSHTFSHTNTIKDEQNYYFLCFIKKKLMQLHYFHFLQ
jgi:hypothetical protein